MAQTSKEATAADVLRARWRKSQYSNPCGSCIEICQLAHGRVAVRNSRHPGGLVLVSPQAGMAAFIHGVKAGTFITPEDATGAAVTAPAWPQSAARAGQR